MLLSATEIFLNGAPHGRNVEARGLVQTTVLDGIPDNALEQQRHRKFLRHHKR
jgi:hypothetical protein